MHERCDLIIIRVIFFLISAGVNLPELCKALLNSPRRALSKVISSSGAAAASSGSESAPAAGATFGPAGSPVGAPAPM